ncbi:hypothetical protein GCM10007424_00260 [Flavobacterium suaedae]|uniref:Uncharacterized protein n=1 Tax=Flavobacterium suaedae TaxID=1767027 RepID=A0ABQ1JD74_9FLAO|nr:hypothetical protein [Flavobacterium suaedae]GGB64337.1 hypothetical protein GCM10007424_00260 [Flavobacterium suaedae]
MKNKNEMLTTNQLYELVTDQLTIEAIHPLHRSILEECCEHVLANTNLDTQSIVIGVQVAFLACERTLRTTLKASLDSFNADEITLNYRGKTFIIKKDSPFLKKYLTALN